MSIKHDSKKLDRTFIQSLSNLKAKVVVNVRDTFKVKLRLIIHYRLEEKVEFRKKVVWKKSLCPKGIF